MIPTYNANTIPVLSLPPDWSSQVKWRQRYSTTITEALDGTEERQERFPRPLYGLSFKTFTLSQAETAYLRVILEQQDAMPIACPLWPLACRLTAAVSAGAASLTVDNPTECMLVLHPDANAPLAEAVFSEYALLWEAWDHWEVVELSSVTEAGSVTLGAALAKTYSTSAMLLPLAYGHVPRGDIGQITDEVGTWTCDFNETFHRLHDQSVTEDVVSTFDPGPCAIVGITNGGGDKFNCYSAGMRLHGDDVSLTSVPFENAGTGFEGVWVVVGATYFGDRFNNYTVGGFAAGMNGGRGFSSDWIYTP